MGDSERTFLAEGLVSTKAHRQGEHGMLKEREKGMSLEHREQEGVAQDEIKKRRKGQVIQALVGHRQENKVYPECDGKPLQAYNQHLESE